jgi:Uma2 family endonuclease
MAAKPGRAGKPASYEDILALPENKVGEIADGELFVSPRPAPRHSLAASTLGGDLIGPFSRGRGGPGGWLILDEPELHLGADVLVPDIGGWRRERMPRLPTTAWFELAPDWVCEVLSPSTALLDRTRKQRIYGRNGVSWLWFVDPLARLLEAWRLEHGEWILSGAFGGDEPARIPPFEAVAIELQDLWEPLPPAPDTP